MKKLLLSLVVVLGLAASAKATFVAQYNFSSTNLASSDTDSSSVAGNLTPVGILPNSGVVTSDGNLAPSFKFDKSDITTSTATKYVEFTVTANANLQMSLNTLTFDIKNNVLGKTASYSVFSSLNNYQTALLSGTSTGSWSTKTINLNGFASATSVTFRIYAYQDAASPAGQDVFLDNISLDANGVTPVPEPTNIALVLFGCTFAGVGAGRKFLKKKVA